MARIFVTSKEALRQYMGFGQSRQSVGPRSPYVGTVWYEISPARVLPRYGGAAERNVGEVFVVNSSLCTQKSKCSTSMHDLPLSFPMYVAAVSATRCRNGLPQETPMRKITSLNRTVELT